MKKYIGITDSDKPKYCGTYVTEQNAGNDIFNFSEYNGKCYGYVHNEGDLVLPAHVAQSFDLEDDQDEMIEDVLVVWCSFKDKNTARIVGWYKNAILFRQEQYQPSFTNPDYDLDYYFQADSKDCVLLPENQRTFKMERAAKAGKGKGFGTSDIWFADSPYARNELIPQVLDYIGSYAGPRENFVLTDEMIRALPVEINAVSVPGEKTAQQQEFIQKGLAVFEQEDYLTALSWFNAACPMKETPDVLYYMAFCLYNLSAFDEARVLLEKSLASGPESFPAMELLAFCSDMTGDWDITIEYLEKMLELTKDESAKEEILRMTAEMHAYLDEEE